MKYIGVISLILCFFCCQEPKEGVLLSTINNITKNRQENFYVVIVSDTDCSSCINHVIKKVSMLNSSKVYGIYFTGTKIISDSSYIDRTISNKNLPVKWVKSTNISLMKLLYETGGVATGPYLVKVGKNEIISTTAF